MYVIAEYLFMENFIINYLILVITKKITRTRVSRKRIIITAIIAALYPFIIFIPELFFLGSFGMKFIISIFIVKLGYNSKSLILFLKQLLGFYMMTFLFAGSTIGIYYFMDDFEAHIINFNNHIGSFPFKFLFLGIIMGIIMIENIFNYFKEKASKERELVNVQVHYNEKEANIISLIDTGNSLIEPISRDPVLIVEYGLIKSLLPKELTKVFDANLEGDFLILEETMEMLKDDIVLKLIPFKAIGTSNGILIGFKPNYIIVAKDNKTMKYEDVIIGIFNNRLTKDDQYNSLLNSEILIRGELDVYQV